jgi:ABC-type oligopeptide transport system substrate-binding subunit
MAFWNRKNPDTTTHNFAPYDQESYDKMMEALAKTTESVDKAAVKITRAADQIQKAARKP